MDSRASTPRTEVSNGRQGAIRYLLDRGPRCPIRPCHGPSSHGPAALSVFSGASTSCARACDVGCMWRSELGGSCRPQLPLIRSLQRVRSASICACLSLHVSLHDLGLGLLVANQFGPGCGARMCGAARGPQCLARGHGVPGVAAQMARPWPSCIICIGWAAHPPAVRGAMSDVCSARNPVDLVASSSR
jgi:hypothetical protein